MTTPLVSKGFDRDAGTARRRRRHGDPFGWSALALDVVTLSTGIAIVAAISPTASPTGQVPSEGLVPIR